MSRWIDYNHDDRRINETIASEEECKYLINDVCTNPSSQQCCDFPHPEEYCKKRCPHFTKEDGIIEP